MSESSDKYGVSENFERDFDSWVTDGKPDERRIFVGTTSVALRSVGIKEQQIIWDTSKIIRTQIDHNDMSDSVLRQVPTIIGNPIIVMESLTKPNRVTIYGEVYSDKDVPVLAVLELLPISRGNYALDIIKLASTYARTGGLPAVQDLIDRSNILYICPDKTRTDTWLSLNKLQLPLGITKYGSIGKVTYLERDVNGNFSADSGELPEPEWKSKLRCIDLNDTDIEVNEPVIVYGASKISEGVFQLGDEIEKSDRVHIIGITSPILIGIGINEIFCVNPK